MIPFNREEVRFHFSDFRGRKKSRYTIASFLDKATRIFYFGISRCDPVDNFDRPKGKSIACARLEAYIKELNDVGRFNISQRLERYVFQIQFEKNAKLTLSDNDFNAIIQNWRKIRTDEQQKRMTEDMWQDFASRDAMKSYGYEAD